MEGSKSDQRPENVPFPHNIAPQAIAAEASEAPIDTAVQASVTEADTWANVDFDVDMLSFENLLDSLPMPSGFDNSAFFESMLTPSSSFF